MSDASKDYTVLVVEDDAAMRELLCESLTEEGYRVHSFGGSFDYGMELGSLPLVLRGEFLYDKDEMQPVVDKRLLGIGDLTNALVMEEMDKFSYVLGADFTFLTNMLVSGQFIQMRNLDYVDDGRTCTTQTGINYDCSRYTADFSTVHMTNGMNEGWENKEFYSLSPLISRYSINRY